MILQFCSIFSDPFLGSFCEGGIKTAAHFIDRCLWPFLPLTFGPWTEELGHELTHLLRDSLSALVTYFWKGQYFCVSVCVILLFESLDTWESLLWRLHYNKIPFKGNFVVTPGTQASTMIEIRDITKETQNIHTLFFWNYAKHIWK